MFFFYINFHLKFRIEWASPLNQPKSHEQRANLNRPKKKETIFSHTKWSEAIEWKKRFGLENFKLKSQPPFHRHSSRSIYACDAESTTGAQKCWHIHFVSLSEHWSLYFLLFTPFWLFHFLQFHWFYSFGMLKDGRFFFVFILSWCIRVKKKDKDIDNKSNKSKYERFIIAANIVRSIYQGKSKSDFSLPNSFFSFFSVQLYLWLKLLIQPIINRKNRWRWWQKKNTPKRNDSTFKIGSPFHFSL